MTDSTCTRYGYDDTGRYHVPAVSSNDHVSQTGNFPVAGNMDDQCPECRCAPGQPHAPDCPTQTTEQSANPLHPTLHINITEDEADSSPAHVSQTGNFPGSGNMAAQEPGLRTRGRVEAALAQVLSNDELRADAEAGLPTQNSCPGCNPVCVPLPLQTRLLEAFLLDEWVENLRAFAERHKDEIVDMTFQRLRDGFDTYGSEMYGWSPERRTDEMCQEIADCNAYGSSGEVT